MKSEDEAAKRRARETAELQLAIDEGIAGARDLAERRAAVSEARLDARRRPEPRTNRRHDDRIVLRRVGF